MKTIFKYRLWLRSGGGVIELPSDHRVLHCGEQNGELFLWAIVDGATDKVNVSVRIFGTGWDVTWDQSAYFQTVQMSDGLVWHVFLQGATR